MINEKILGIFISMLLIAVPVSSLAGTMNDESKQNISSVSINNSWIEQGKLNALDGVAGDQFGYSVSIDGNYAIVGACYDDSEKGSAYIFKRNGTTWSQEVKLNAFDGKESDRFGCSVSIDGNYAIVGAYAKNSWTGAAYVFKCENTSWFEMAKLTASDGEDGDYFGYSVSMDGSRAIVGAYGDRQDTGSAYIFIRGCCGWDQAAKLTASDREFRDYFGYSVSIDEIHVIVGAYGDDDMGTDSGSAYIFNRTGATWIEEQKLNASDGETEDKFGASVSITQNYAIIGAYDNDDMGNNSGSAYIYNKTGATWSQDAKLTAFDGEKLDAFGRTVSNNGSYVIIGAFYDDDLGNDSGSAYVFRGHNQPPNIPTITGPPSGQAGKDYTYKFNSFDPDGDDVKYHINWGDDETETTAFYPSGINVWINHTWSTMGNYTIKVKAEDICGLVGPEATFVVTLPRNKMATNIQILNFLKQYPNLFPILRLLLLRLGLQY